MAGLLIPLVIELSITACCISFWSSICNLVETLPHQFIGISNYCNHSYRMRLIIVSQALYCPSIAASSFLHGSPAHLLLLLLWMELLIPLYLYLVTVVYWKTLNLYVLFVLVATPENSTFSWFFWIYLAASLTSAYEAHSVFLSSLSHSLILISCLQDSIR